MLLQQSISSQMHVLCSDREGIITPGALVLCPNATLCNQVKLVADSLTDTAGKPLLETAHVSNSSPPPFTVPDIVVTTPASLINITEASHYGPEWTKGGILARYADVLGYSLTALPVQLALSLMPLMYRRSSFWHHACSRNIYGHMHSSMTSMSSMLEQLSFPCRRLHS